MESVALHPTKDKPDYAADRELARRCAKGDERALREVFEAHEPLLRKLIYRNLGSREDAEEVVATTFLRFWRSARHYRGASSLRGYLIQIALNLCHDAGRRRRTVVSTGALGAPPEAPPQDEHPMADRIRRGLLQLPRQDRELLSLYYLQECEYDEICDTLSISYDVLRTRLVRARKRLRSIVEESND